MLADDRAASYTRLLPTRRAFSHDATSDPVPVAWRRPLAVHGGPAGGINQNRRGVRPAAAASPREAEGGARHIRTLGSRRLHRLDLGASADGVRLLRFPRAYLSPQISGAG